MKESKDFVSKVHKLDSSARKDDRTLQRSLPHTANSRPQKKGRRAHDCKYERRDVASYCTCADAGLLVAGAGQKMVYPVSERVDLLQETGEAPVKLFSLDLRQSSAIMALP